MSLKDTETAFAYRISDKYTTAYLLMTIINMQCDFSRLLKGLDGKQRECCLSGLNKAQDITRDFIPLFEESGFLDILQVAAEIQGLEPYWHMLLDKKPKHSSDKVDAHCGTHTINS